MTADRYVPSSEDRFSFTASGQSSFIAGAELVVDGGMSQT